MIERTIRFLFPMSGGPQFGLSVRLIFRVRRGFRSSVAARVLFEMAVAAAVSASSLLFAVRVRNRMRGDAADTPSRSLLLSESIPIWRVARLPPPCVGWPADSVHSSLFPHCQCFKRRFLPPSLLPPSKSMSMAASKVASFVCLSVGGLRAIKGRKNNAQL